MARPISGKARGVFPLRLSASERAALMSAAEAAGVPVSRLARDFIVSCLKRRGFPVED